MAGAREEDGGSAERAYLPALRFQRLTPLFDRVAHAATREPVSKSTLVEQAGLEPGLEVLDLGSGTGTLAMMAKQAEPDCEIVGLDADPGIIVLAREKASAAGVDVRFDEGLADSLPYPDGSFDRVLSSLFFHHLTPEDKRGALSEIARVLRPGGELHVADFSAPADPAQWLLSWQVRLFDGLARTGENFTGRLPALFSAAGLEDVRKRGRLRTLFGTLAFLSARR